MLGHQVARKPQLFAGQYTLATRRREWTVFSRAVEAVFA
jgi:hypothetical protein